MFFIPGSDMGNAQSQFYQGREYIMSKRFLTGIKIDLIHDTWDDLVVPVPKVTVFLYCCCLHERTSHGFQLFLAIVLTHFLMLAIEMNPFLVLSVVG